MNEKEGNQTQKPVMISVMGCRTSERVQVSVASHLLCDLNPPNCNAPEIEITLQNLYSLLENPSLSKNIKRLDSVDTLLTELVACKLPTTSATATLGAAATAGATVHGGADATEQAVSVFVDLTSAHQKRDCMNSLKVCQAISHIVIIAATGPDLTPTASASAMRSVGEAAQHMLTELLHGIDCISSGTLASSSERGGGGAEVMKVRAGVMAVQIQPSSTPHLSEDNVTKTRRSQTSSSSSSSCPPSSSPSSIFMLSEQDRKLLDACILVQKQFQSSDRVQPPPPLFIQMVTLGDKTHSSPLEYLQAKGVDLSSIAMCGNVISLSNVSYFEILLRQFPDFKLLIDCFGAVEKPLLVDHNDNNDNNDDDNNGGGGGGGGGEFNNNYPSDEEICQAVKTLISSGFVNRLIITSSVTSKLNLITYGGPGYYHIQRSVIPRFLRLGIRSEHIKQLTVRNLITFVTWYTPPPEIPVEKETFQCFICDKKSTFGDHYEKFEFFYCSSKCLREHAKRKWAK